VSIVLKLQEVVEATVEVLQVAVDTSRVNPVLQVKQFVGKLPLQVRQVESQTIVEVLQV